MRLQPFGDYYVSRGPADAHIDDLRRQSTRDESSTIVTIHVHDRSASGPEAAPQLPKSVRSIEPASQVSVIRALTGPGDAPSGGFDSEQFPYLSLLVSSTDIGHRVHLPTRSRCSESRSLIRCTANPVLQGGVKSADGEAVPASCLGAESASVPWNRRIIVPGALRDLSQSSRANECAA